jgi:hypothetical protein
VSAFGYVALLGFCIAFMAAVSETAFASHLTSRGRVLVPVMLGSIGWAIWMAIHLLVAWLAGVPADA